MKTQKLKKQILTFFLIGIIMLVFYKCPYDFLLGLSCPGCGMTRAFLSLARFDIQSAFYYHPLFPVVILFVGYLILEHFHLFTLTDKHKRIGIWIICILFIAVYFIRLFGESEIVTFSFGESLLYKIIMLLKNKSAVGV